MRRRNHLDLLPVAVGSRMIVGPGDGRRLAVIPLMSGRIGIEIPAVEVIGGANSGERTHRASKVHVIARDHEAAAFLAESGDPGAIPLVETVTGVDREKPELGVV